MKAPGSLRFVALTFVAVAACSDSSQPVSPTPSLSNVFTLSGTVYEYGPFGRRPLANVPLDISAGHVLNTPLTTSDSTGRYSYTGPPMQLKVRADLSGFSQPCRANLTLVADETLDVHLVASDVLLTTGMPESLPIGGRISGLVYEQTTQGDVPVAGATVKGLFSRPLLGFVPLTETRTDASGLYTMCSADRFSVSAHGFRPVEIADLFEYGYDVWLVRD